MLESNPQLLFQAPYNTKTIRKCDALQFMRRLLQPDLRAVYALANSYGPTVTPMTNSSWRDRNRYGIRRCKHIHLTFSRCTYPERFRTLFNQIFFFFVKVKLRQSCQIRKWLPRLYLKWTLSLAAQSHIETKIPCRLVNMFEHWKCEM